MLNSRKLPNIITLVIPKQPNLSFRKDILSVCNSVDGVLVTLSINFLYKNGQPAKFYVTDS